VITSHSSRILSVTPATRDQPRFLARETVAAFEVANPALRGIGDVMQDMGSYEREQRREQVFEVRPDEGAPR